MIENRYYKKLYIIMMAVTIIIGAAFFVLLWKRPVNNYSFDVAMSNPDVGRVEEDGYYFDTKHADELEEDGQKVYLNIPQGVKAGSYTIRIGYRSNAGSTISVTSNSNPGAVKCDQIALNHRPEELPGEFNMNYGLGYLPGFVNAEMYITRDVPDLDIYTVYCGFQDFYIQSVELIGNRNYAKTIWIATMALLIILELVTIAILKGFFKSDIGVAVLIISGITLLVSVPLLFRMGLLFDDGNFLYGKLGGIIDGIRDGQFPVRVHPNTLRGYGYALGYFYPELFLYPFALLSGMGYSLRFCVYTLMFCINLATVAVSYISVRRIIGVSDECKSIFVLAICAFIYAFNPYRLVDMYSRGAVAETLAIVFLPLIVTGLYIIIAENGNISWLVAGLFGLVNSHVLSCELVAVFAILLCIVCFKKIFNKNTFIKLLISCIITALLSAYFLIPFLHMSTTDSYRVYAGNAYDTSAHMLSLTDIFGLSVSTVGKINNGTLFSTRYTLGIVIILLTVGLYMRLLSKHRANRFVNICFVFGMISLWLSSNLFPWRAVENIGGIVRTVFCMVQFPWRYLSIAMACFMFVIAIGLTDIFGDNSFEKGKEGQKSVLAMAGFTIVCIIVFIQSVSYFATLKITASDNQLIYDGAALTKYNMVGMGEYMPVNFEDSDLDHSIEELQYIYDENTIINGTDEDASKGLTIGPLSRTGTDSSILIINPTEEERSLYMPITYYEGYRVENIAKSEDGVEVLPEQFETEFGTVGLKVPAGYYNGAHITYHENVLYRISEFISVLTLALLAIYRTKRELRDHITE